MTTTVASALDVTLPLSRNTPTVDTSGHSVDSYASVGTIKANVIKPSASVLQQYAGIIGSQRAVVLRVMNSTDIRQTDHLTYDGVVWTIQERLDASSYSVTQHFLMTVIV